MEDLKSEACGPGCNCGKPSGNKKAKIVICLAVLLAICGIFVYKANSAKQTAQDNTKAEFTAPVLNQAIAKELSIKSSQGSQKMGEIINSLKELNNLAANQDAVFIFIPANDNDTISKESLNAIASAEQKIKSSGVKIGSYTLQFSMSKEYASIASQLTLPSMLVISKGKGMGTVSGEITEEKLLQAYVASSRAGGCGPSSSCGPSTPGCGPSTPSCK